ncbi:MAG: nucleotidyltransferase family protein [Deltaproteobacteria bacterium]|nr:nucleotidyltransferase family protein [Deltaproteobacteria bacterium]
MSDPGRNAFALRTLLAERLQPEEERRAPAEAWIERASSAGLEHVLDFARREGVKPLLAKDLLAEPGDGLPPALRERLEQSLRLARGHHLQQARMLQEVGEWLDAADVPHVVFKGPSLAHRLYPEPATRQATDLDLLVPRDRRDEVLRGFASRGYTIHRAAERDSHECDVLGPAGAIDLHWDLLRPGRLRFDLAARVLTKRVRRGALWVPRDADLLLLALIHPAITEHVTARLLKAVDLDLALRLLAPAWGETLETLGRLGLRTAAWAQLTWTRSFFASPLPLEVERTLEPPGWQARYLRTWLNRDPAAQYPEHRHLVRAGFSLALHDSPLDVMRALGSYAGSPAGWFSRNHA